MTHVSIRGLRKDFAGSTAIDGIDIEIESGSFVTLLGPSGCGKTTTLRCLAGLETPTAGEILIDGKVVSDPQNGIFIRPEKQRVGMVFQSYGLWPHMTVAGNVGYPLRLQKMRRREIRERVSELLTIVELEEQIDRSASALSGGQQQRVALARALANGSSLVLYDEPLSNLDARLRASTRDEIRSVHNRMGSTSVLVTHDQQEALTMSDKIIVMNRGRIEQIGTPREIYTNPSTRFVARFMGVENVFQAQCVRSTADASLMRIADSSLELVVPPGIAVGERAGLAFRAAHIRVVDSKKPETESGSQNRLSGIVSEAVFVGDHVEMALDVGGVSVRASVLDTAEHRPEAPRPGDSVDIQLPVSNISTLPPD